jgi:hypothetical protein
MATLAFAPPKVLAIKAAPGSEQSARKYDRTKLIADRIYLNHIRSRDRIVGKKPSAKERTQIVTEFITENDQAVKIQYKHSKAKYVASIYARVLPPPPPSSVVLSMKTALLLQRASKLKRDKFEKELQRLDSDFYTRIIKLKKQQRDEILFQTWMSNMMILAGGSILLYGSVTLFGPAAISFLLKKGLLHSRLVKTLFKASLEACFNLRPDQLATLDPLLQSLDMAMMLAQAESIPPLDTFELFSLAFNGKNPFTDSITDEDLKKNLVGADGMVNGGLKEYQDSIINFNNALYDLILPDFLAPFFHIKPVPSPGTAPPTAPAGKPTPPGQPRDLREQIEEAFKTTDTEIFIDQIRAIIDRLNSYLKSPIGPPQIDLMLLAFKKIHKAQVVTQKLFSTAEFTVSFYKQYKFQIDNVIGYITGKETRSQEFKKNYLDSILNKVRSNLTLRNEFSAFTTGMILGDERPKEYKVTSELAKQIKDIPLFGNVILFYESITPANCIGYVSGVVYDEMTGMITSKIQTFYPSSIAMPPPLPGDDDERKDEEKRKIQAYKDELAEIQKSLIKKGVTGNVLVDTIRKFEKIKHPDYVYKKEDIDALEYAWMKAGDTFKMIKQQGLFGNAVMWSSLASLAYLYGYTMNFTENVNTEMKGSFKDVFSFWTTPFVNVIKSILTTNATAAMARILLTFEGELDKIYNTVYEEYVRRPMRESKIYLRWEELNRDGKEWLANKLENRFYLSSYIHGALDSVLDLFFRTSVSVFTEAPNRWVRQYTYTLKTNLGLQYITNLTIENLILNTIPNNVGFLYESLAEQNKLPDNVFDAFNLNSGVAAMRHQASRHRGEWDGVYTFSRIARNFVEAGQPSASGAIPTGPAEREEREPSSGPLGPIIDTVLDTGEAVIDRADEVARDITRQALEYIEEAIYRSTESYHDVRYTNAGMSLSLPGGLVLNLDEKYFFDYTKLRFAETYAETLLSENKPFSFDPERVNDVIRRFNMNFSEDEKNFLLTDEGFRTFLESYYNSIKGVYDNKDLSQQDKYTLLGRRFLEEQEAISRKVIDDLFGVKPLPMRYVSINGSIYIIEPIPSDDPNNPNKDMRPTNIKPDELVGTDLYLYSHLFGVTLRPIEISDIPTDASISQFPSMDSFNRGFLQVTYGRGIIKDLLGRSIEEELNPISTLDPSLFIQARNYNFVGDYFYTTNIPVSVHLAHQNARSQIMIRNFADDAGTLTRGVGSPFERELQRYLKYNPPLENSVLKITSEDGKMSDAMSKFQKKVNGEPDPQRRTILQEQWTAYQASDPIAFEQQGQCPDVSVFRIDPLIFAEAYAYKTAARAKQIAESQFQNLLPTNLRKSLERNRKENIAAIEEKIKRRRQVIDALIAALPPDDDDPDKVNINDLKSLETSVNELRRLDPSSLSETIEVEEEVLGVKVKRRINIYSFFDSYIESLKNGRATKTDVYQLKAKLNTLSGKYNEVLGIIKSFETRQFNEDPALVQAYFAEINSQFVNLFNNQRSILTKNANHDRLVEAFPRNRNLFEQFYLERRYQSINSRNNDLITTATPRLQQKQNALLLIDPVVLNDQTVRTEIDYFNGKITLLGTDLGKEPVETVAATRKTPEDPEGTSVRVPMNFVRFKNGEIDFETARNEINAAEARLTELEGRVSKIEGDIDIFLGSLDNRAAVEHRVFDVSRRILGLIPDDKKASRRSYIPSQANGNYYMATREEFYLHPDILAAMSPEQVQQYNTFRTQQSDLQSRAGARNNCGIQIQALWEIITEKLANLPPGAIITQEIIDLNARLTTLMNKYDFNLKSELGTLNTQWDLFRQQMGEVYRAKRIEDLATQNANLPERPISIGTLLQLRNNLQTFSDTYTQVPLFDLKAIIDPSLDIPQLISDLDLTIGAFTVLFFTYDGAGQMLVNGDIRTLLTYTTPDLAAIFEQGNTMFRSLLETHAKDSTGTVRDFSFLESQLDRLVMVLENQLDIFIGTQKTRVDLFDTRVRNDIIGNWVNENTKEYRSYFGSSSQQAEQIFSQISEFANGISASSNYNSRIGSILDVGKNPARPQNLGERILALRGKYDLVVATVNDLESLSPNQIKVALQGSTRQLSTYLFDLEVLKNKDETTDLLDSLANLHDRDLQVLLDIPDGTVSLQKQRMFAENRELRGTLGKYQMQYLRIKYEPSESKRVGELRDLNRQIRETIASYELRSQNHQDQAVNLKFQNAEYLFSSLSSRKQTHVNAVNTGLESVPEGVDVQPIADYEKDVLTPAFDELSRLRTELISIYADIFLTTDIKRHSQLLTVFNAKYTSFLAQATIISRYLASAEEQYTNIESAKSTVETTETLTAIIDSESGSSLNLDDPSATLETVTGSFDANRIGDTDITNNDINQLSGPDSQRGMENAYSGITSFGSIDPPIIDQPAINDVTTATVTQATAIIGSDGTIFIDFTPSDPVPVNTPATNSAPTAESLVTGEPEGEQNRAIKKAILSTATFQRGTLS